MWPWPHTSATEMWGDIGRVGKMRNGCNSFVPGVMVVMADGTHKPIEEVQIGDSVLATDPITGENEAKPVVALIIGQGEKNLVQITVDVDGVSGDGTGIVLATDLHPFWVQDQGHWFSAKDLKAGMRLLNIDGAGVTVVSVRSYRKNDQRVYNLTIDGLHTFRVAVGDVEVLVHNARPCFVGPPMTLVEGKQFGKKWGKHAQDFNLDVSNPAHRKWFWDQIHETYRNPDEVRRGAWNPRRGGGYGYWFYRKGNMLVLLKHDGTFVTAFPTTGNKWWDQARKMS